MVWGDAEVKVKLNQESQYLDHNKLWPWVVQWFNINKVRLSPSSSQESIS